MDLGQKQKKKLGTIFPGPGVPLGAQTTTAPTATRTATPSVDLNPVRPLIKIAPHSGGADSFHLGNNITGV